VEERVRGQAVLAHTSVEDQGEPGLHPRGTVGDLAEITAALLLGAAQTPRSLVEAERAMVRRDNLKVVGPQSAPQCFLMRPRAQRRRHDVLRPLEVGAIVGLLGQERRRWARLGLSR